MNEILLGPQESKDMVRLLRHLGDAVALLSPGEDGLTIVVEKAPGAPRRYPAALLRKACALGLAARTGNKLSARGEARTFLRRALTGEENEAFPGQHRETATIAVETAGRRQSVRVNLAESPLACLARLKDKTGAAFLPPQAIDAGETLLADFTRAQLQPRVTASWEPRLASRGKGHAGGLGDLTDSAVAARRRVNRAIEAMGPELAGVALDVCCFMKGLETVERERQWPARSAKLMLRAALLALNRHYKPPPPDKSLGPQHWGTVDFRPDL